MEKKNILVTGGSGFIGTNFIRFVLEARPGWRVVNLDALTYAGNAANLDDLPPGLAERLSFVHGDIRDGALLERLFSQEEFDGVIHLAAESHVDRSILGPEAFLETNVLGTFRLLDASKVHWESKGRPDGFKFLHISTDEVYGSLGPEGLFTEHSRYDPSSPYSASKASSDHFVRAFFRTYGLPVNITNCSNNFGPYQFPEKLIPLFLLNILDEKPLPVYGDGKNVRDWLYVSDHCEALLTVFENGGAGETYNVGGNAETTNLALVETLCRAMDRKLELPEDRSSERLIRFVKDRPGHDRRYAIDASKIRNELGWIPKHDFGSALEETVDWYLGHMEWVRSIQTGEYRKWIELNYDDRA